MVQQSTYQKKAEEADRLGNEVISLQQRNKALAEENEQLKQQVQKLGGEKKQEVAAADAGAQAGPPEKEEPKVEEEKIAEPAREKAAESPEVATAPVPPEKKAADAKAMRLKVLSGNGKMSSAKKMSARLTKLGYKVEVVGMATTPDYVTDTIYYKSGFEKQAAGMAKKLGGKAITKPLTWSSVFDIIVVAVR
jgi:seryl-tRNA synthetase